MLPEDFANQFSVSRETIERLKIYEHLLQDWGKTLSLVSRSTLDDIWHRHFTDSAQILPMIEGKTPILDMGSGAGFPGMVLAIMGTQAVHLSDNNQKKVGFLRAVAYETGTDIVIHNCKAEAVPDDGFRTLTARGLASLDHLLTISHRLLGRGSQAIFLKGRSHETEVSDAMRHWTFHAEAIPSVTSPDSAILRITHLEKRAAA